MKKIVFLFLTAVVLLSCDKDKSYELESKNIMLKGVLSFKTFQDFQAEAKRLSSLNLDEKKVLNSKRGFESLNEI